MLRMKEPSSPPSCIAVMVMPSDTPACGRSVMPRYLQMLSSHFVAFAEAKAPMYFPAERNMIYIAPTATTDSFVNTESSSSAPLITKNSTSSGPLHLSARSIISSEVSHILQNTEPSIMQVSSDEKPMFTSPIEKFSFESATVRITNVMEIARRLLFEWKKVSVNVNKSPTSAPRTSEHTTSSNGSTIMDTIST